MNDPSHGAWGSEEVLALLGDRNAPPELLARIARDARWSARPDVRVGLVRHPRAPYAVARRFLSHLRWTELVDLSRNLRVSPVLRRDADRLLATRLTELAVGERITLARRAPRGLVAALREAGEEPVLDALLDNPSLTERDAAALAADAATPGPVLRRLSRHPAWGSRPAVRRALLRNRATPAPAALRIVGALDRRELVRAANDETAAPLVRIAARRRIEAAVHRAGDTAPRAPVDTTFERSLQSPGFRRR